MDDDFDPSCIIDDNNDPLTTANKVKIYETVTPLLANLQAHALEFSRKRPDGLLPLPTIRLANRLLAQVRIVVAREAEAPFVQLLDKGPIDYSQLTIMLGQASAALRAFYARYWRMNEMFGEAQWFIYEPR